MSTSTPRPSPRGVKRLVRYITNHHPQVPVRRVLFANVVDPMPLNLPFRDDLELLLRLNNSDIRDGLWMFMALGLPHYSSYGKAMAVDYISRLTR